jgi:hypothetical protein
MAMTLTRLKHYVWGLVFLVGVGLPNTSHALPIGILLGVVEAAYQAYQAFNGSNDAAVHQEILQAVARAATDIQNAMASIAISEVESCADALLLDFENFLRYNPDVQQDFARDYLHCLTRAVRLMDEPTTSRAGVDRLGRVLHIVATVTLFVHESLGFTTQGIQHLVQEGNQKVLTKLRPVCSLRVGEPGSPERRMTCRAYNGDTAVDYVLPNTPWFAQDKVRLEDEAARNTSYLIAKAMLAAL